MFSKVLVANRGEIAVRIIRSLHEMGIAAVAVYSTADRDSLHVRLADEAVCVGGARPQDSYLNMKNILAAAVGTGAQAIHPGFGFLSENAEFAEMCAKCDLKFIGPKAETIDLMGSKEHAREQMKKSGVPVVPGSEGCVDNADQARAAARKIGYPVLLKAAAGGGGKGIRRVENDRDLTRIFNEAQNEARISFGDGRMYLEKILERVKHIEVQVFRDQKGHAVCFPERDCSIQRGKQKLIEESPCPVITPPERKNLQEIALQALRGIDYENTGTLEFLMDQDHHFYFIEMNTRIQVEHTVTESVTGIDLVKEQVRVAAGLPLSFKQDDIKVNGHAIECRINAEDPRQNFLPQTGRVDYLYLPAGNPGARIDTDIYSGAKITPFYDSMIAKVIAHGRTRREAIEKVKRLLQEMVISGIITNQDFHLAILNDPEFLSGRATTAFLEQDFLPKWKGGAKQ